MLISHAGRFAFIHVPKTGGCSISQALAGWQEPVHDYWLNRWLPFVGIHVNHFAPYRKKRFRLHTTAAVLRGQLPAEVFAGLFKFAFVRNPWDMLVSRYAFLLNTPRHHSHRRAVRFASFAEFVECELARGKAFQSRFVCDRRGNLLVDFVGRFESLREDFARICGRLGIVAHLPHVNRSRRDDRRDWRDAYTPRLAARVAAHLAEDIERFGYRFEPDVCRAA